MNERDVRRALLLWLVIAALLAFDVWAWLALLWWIEKLS